jgi:hypothetical protein
LRPILFPIEHNKPSIPQLPNHSFVHKGDDFVLDYGDLWGMGQED